MTDIHNDTAPTETAPTAGAPAVDTKHTDAAGKKEKMQLLQRLKAIIKKCLPAGKKAKHTAPATGEEEPAADAPEDLAAAPEPAPLEA